MRESLCIYAAAAAVCLLAASCGKEALKTTYGKQEQYIESIVESLSKDDTVSVTRNEGSVRVTIAEGEGEGLREGGAVSFRVLHQFRLTEPRQRVRHQLRHFRGVHRLGRI